MLLWILGLAAVIGLRTWWSIPAIASAGVAVSSAIYWFGARDYQEGLGLPVSGLAGVVLGAALGWAIWAAVAAIVLLVLKRRAAARARQDESRRP